MTNPPRIYALIVAAGTGERAGGAIPKQYQPIGGKPMLRHSCEAFSHTAAIAGIQVVIHPEHHARYSEATAHLTLLPPVFGGIQRSDSVRAGLHALALYQPDYVLIHDAARPFLSATVLNAILAALSPETGVVPVLQAVDTMRRLEGGAWAEVPREGLYRIQTPQAFPFAALHEIYSAADFTPATDEAALWLAAGKPLAYVAGEEELRKMTTAQDIHAAPALGGLRRIAVGMGFDVHELMPSGEKHTMRLGGIDIDHDHKLHGHSDADVALHAIVDALLGALGEGDIGAHYSPTDERWKGADSRQFVEDAYARVRARDGIIQHVDVTIICEQPKIAPHREAMRMAIASLLHLPLSHVSVKATTTEKLGFTGRSEGIAAQAIATVSLPEDA